MYGRLSTARSVAGPGRGRPAAASSPARARLAMIFVNATESRRSEWATSTVPQGPSEPGGAFVRLRGKRCLASSVAPPFQTAYWADIEALKAQLGWDGGGTGSLTAAGVPPRLTAGLSALLGGLSPTDAATAWSLPWAADVRRREAFRATHRAVVFLGRCSREVALGALEVATERLIVGSQVEVRLKDSDVFAELGSVQEWVREVLGYLAGTRRFHAHLMLLSDTVPAASGVRGLFYDCPQARIGWFGMDLAGCAGMAELARLRNSSESLQNLAALADDGAWPHVVVPVSQANVRFLPELVPALIDLTRGGTVELAPVPLLRRGAEAAAARVNDYVEALVALYRNPGLPLRLVSPLSWVVTRIDAELPLVASASEAGAEVAVLPNGDLYAAEAAVGLEEWRLGNVLDGGEEIRWERLDAIAEAFSCHNKPATCQRCDWRYRCGGVDASVQLLEEARRGRVGGASLQDPMDGAVGRVPSRGECSVGRLPSDGGDPTDGEPRRVGGPGLQDPLGDGPSLFDLYCAPRKALFEEAIWDAADRAKQAAGRRSRELLHLREEGVDFEPAPTTQEDSCR